MEKYSEILLVEDNRNDSELFFLTMKAGGEHCRIIHLNDGDEALDYIFMKGRFRELNSYRNVKLIVLDIKLPKVDGFSVLKEIKSNQLTRHIPVIIFSSSEDETDISKSYDLGANSYILKPVDFTFFEETVTVMMKYWLNMNRMIFNNESG